MLQRLLSIFLVVTLAASGIWGWFAVSLLVLTGASVAAAWLTVRLSMARAKALPKPEMTYDNLGQLVPRLGGDSGVPLSIHIEVLEAKDVPAMDGGGTSDPYIIVTMWAKKRYGRGGRKMKWVEVSASCPTQRRWTVPNTKWP